MTTQPPTDGSSPSRLGERYELGALIGRGGMADVRAGRDLRLGRTVAIKRLRTDLASDPTFQARFRREAQSAASLNHPSIVAVYDTAEESDNEGHLLPYIVMEYVEGRTLREVLREGRKILPERALEITADVLSALDYSHRAGIVHRDIKPANVMLTPNGQVKVMDFGIARAVADSSATMTQTAAVLGTAQYLSPEQARGEPVDARSDIYSTGCLLYELLTGRPPLIGDSPVSVAYQHVRETPERPSLYNPEVTDDVDAIVAKALTKRIENRYQSAAEMRADIERALAGQSVTAPAVIGDPGNPGPPGDDSATAVVPALSDYDEEPPGRRKWPWIVLVLLLLALVAAFFIIPAVFGGGGDDGPSQSVPNVVGQKL
ncbi:MAG TPA: Stk1 family PASTA domain-containing Ser/Thr kinase, partial [Nocardioidaceae bacterium]|nr:Stk1 family PASTA domain-containing Ser/Thr kinase [Nocardioidaceae bacterium]